MRQLMLAMAIGCGAAAAVSAQPAQAAQDLPTVTIRIDEPVSANGQPLAPGTYRVRVTAERPALPSGLPSETQRWVEFLAGDQVVAREIAEIVPPEGAAPAAPAQAVVQRLKEGDFVRVSIRAGGVRYLVYLPTGSTTAPK